MQFRNLIPVFLAATLASAGNPAPAVNIAFQGDNGGEVAPCG
jgi:hypothetical protein